MSVLDAARGGRQFSDAELDEPGADSPPRPTMGATDHLGEQFKSVIPAREYEPGYDAEAEMQDFMNDLRSKRRPNHIAGQTIHQYYSAPGSARNG